MELTKQNNVTQASLIIAKRFPRDLNQVYKNIMKACERPTLASTALYAYPRGGSLVTGPSIRLAEVFAQNWGNLDFGIRELEQGNGESKVEAYCWDLENNVRQTKIFNVKHERHSKRGVTKLKDSRDIYELVANNGARRLRACILGIIPKDFVEDAVNQCNKTRRGNSKEPISDRVRKMVKAFGDISVTSEMIEKRLKHTVDVTNEDELMELQTIYTGLKDGVSKRTDWFEYEKKATPETEELNKKFEKKKE